MLDKAIILGVADLKLSFPKNSRWTTSILVRPLLNLVGEYSESEVNTLWTFSLYPRPYMISVQERSDSILLFDLNSNLIQFEAPVFIPR